MRECPVCRGPLQGPNNFCPACGISRPGASTKPSSTSGSASSFRPGQTRATSRPPTPPRLKEENLPPLPLCLLMDALGMASYFLPALGEYADIVWAPISGAVFYLLFRRAQGIPASFGALLAFTEELLPLTDIVPTFTIAWFAARRVQRQQPRK